MIAQFKEKINPFFAFFENIFRSKKRVILRILSILVYIILVFPARKKFLRSPPLAAKEGLSQKNRIHFRVLVNLVEQMRLSKYLYLR